MSEICVVVPIWDSEEQSQHTLNFISQMQEMVSGSWSLCIVDNASPSVITQNFLSFLDDPRIHVIHNTKNLGYGRAANIGAKWGIENGAEYIAILNNDIVILDTDWLENVFLSHLREHKDWLMGARKITFNEGTRYDGVNIVPYLEGWCIACHKDLWVDLGGFDNALYVWHEDVELCIRAEKKGYEIKQSPAFNWVTQTDCDNPPLLHLYGQTGFRKLDFNTISEVSRQYVIQKHFSGIVNNN